MLWRNGNVIIIIWIPASEENELKLAKERAQEATRSGALPQIHRRLCPPSTYEKNGAE
jgi:hypothetical protein